MARPTRCAASRISAAPAATTRSPATARTTSLTGGSGGTDMLSGGDGDDRLIGGGFTATTTYSAPVAAGHHQAPVHQQQQHRDGREHGGRLRRRRQPEHHELRPRSRTRRSTPRRPAARWNITAIDVTAAGAQAIFDIDGSGTLDDSIIELVDSAGTVLAHQRHRHGRRRQSDRHDDAYLTYTFATRGHLLHPCRPVHQQHRRPAVAGRADLHAEHLAQSAAAVTTTVTANNTSSARR